MVEADIDYFFTNDQKFTGKLPGGHMSPSDPIIRFGLIKNIILMLIISNFSKSILYQ